MGEVDHIHASLPCKGFSCVNCNGGKNDIQNNKQTLLFINAIKHFCPKTATFKNLPGLVLEDYKGYLQLVVENLLQMSCQVRVKVLTSSCYGDPQKRQRLILVVVCGDCLLPEMPPPTHGDGPGLIPTMTCKDALHMFEKYPPSSSRSCGAVLVHNLHVFNHIAPRRKFDRDNDFELIRSKPSRTILTRARPHLHYNSTRFILVQEVACLQSFPIKYWFYGSLVRQYAQVGNAPPSPRMLTRTVDGINNAWRGGNVVAGRQRTKAIKNERKIIDKSVLMGTSHALEILGKCKKYNEYLQPVGKSRERGAVTSQ